MRGYNEVSFLREQLRLLKGLILSILGYVFHLDFIKEHEYEREFSVSEWKADKESRPKFMGSLDIRDMSDWEDKCRNIL